MSKVSLIFEMTLELETLDDVAAFGEDMSVFLEEYLNGQQRIDIEFKGHKVL